jgi:hypothetical protein
LLYRQVGDFFFNPIEARYQTALRPDAIAWQYCTNWVNFVLLGEEVEIYTPFDIPPIAQFHHLAESWEIKCRSVLYMRITFIANYDDSVLLYSTLLGRLPTEGGAIIRRCCGVAVG